MQFTIDENNLKSISKQLINAQENEKSVMKLQTIHAPKVYKD